MKLLFLLIKVIFVLLVILPLLLIVGTICLIEEYIILNTFWIRRYTIQAIKSFSIRESIPLDKITNIEVKRSSGGTANMVRRIDIWLVNQNKPVQVLFKKYLLFGSIFSFLGYFLGPYPPSKVSPAQRQNSEETALKCFSQMGIAVPKILFTDHKRKISFFQFIEGIRIDKLLLEYTRDRKEQELLLLFHQYGIYLATIHRSNWSLIDGNPFNFKFSCQEGKIYFTDLELASNSNYKSWDIANSFSLIQKTFTKEIAKKIKGYFLNGYSSVISPESMMDEVTIYLERLEAYNLLNKYVPHINFE